MFETTTNARIRQGFERAHAERGAALRNAWHWLTHRGK